ncbi:MAG TPA: hypothetical protein PKA27_15140 [Fimbriimonadaceae bacterium]|nr:hypothetical protein [Fimbriimonadaceae bacterium]
MAVNYCLVSESSEGCVYRNAQMMGCGSFTFVNGDTLSTGSGCYANILVSDGDYDEDYYVTLWPNTELELQIDGGQYFLEVISGIYQVKHVARGSSPARRVRGSRKRLRIRPIGTCYRCQLGSGDALNLWVIEGSVEMFHDGSSLTTLAAQVARNVTQSGSLSAIVVTPEEWDEMEQTCGGSGSCCE